MKKIFVLIWVHKGFIQEPEFFSEIQAAQLRLNHIKKKTYNPDYDEVEIFEKLI